MLRTTAVRQFCISHLATWLRTRRFSEPNFRPSRPQKSLEKNTVFRDFSSISRICIFFLLTLSLSLFYSSLFYSSLLSDSSHLCFLSLHIVGSFTSKLPSIIPIKKKKKTIGGPGFGMQDNPSHSYPVHS